MPAVQVRDFPDEAYEQLKLEAKESGRSINQHTKIILLEHLKKDRVQQNANVCEPHVADMRLMERKERRRVLFEKIDKLQHRSFPQSFDSTAFVREMRESR